MKVLKLLIVASILTYATARVVGPQIVDSRTKNKQQSKQEDDEGVVVDSFIPASNIEVFEATTIGSTVSSEENSVEVSSSTSAELTSAETETTVNVDDTNLINRYCKCTSFECDCCRDFSLPILPIRGPGCANIRYLEGDRMSIGIKFGNRVLANRVISGRKAAPVCLPLPGGFSNFCGKIYGISKKNEDFKACLGLELRADDEVEAALRVSCFTFGPKGLKVTDGEPIPVAPVEDEDDDEDDLFGFGDGDSDGEDDDILDDDDDDDDDDTPQGQSAAKPESDDEDDDGDYTGLGGILSGDLFDDILGEDDDEEKPAAPLRKNPKKGYVKNQESQNEIDGTLNTEEEASKPATAQEENDNDDDDSDEDGGILGILNELVSGDDDADDEDDKIEDEVSEEIAENELEEASEDVEQDEPAGEKESSVQNHSNNEIEEQELEDAIDDETLDDDLDDDDDLENKPETYAGLSFFGLRNFFSRFFH